MLIALEPILESLGLTGAAASSGMSVILGIIALLMIIKLARILLGNDTGGGGARR